VDKTQLEDLFSQFGKILDIVIKTRNDTFAFIEFEDESGVQAAMAK
jgi:RNA recognition motif-containing protein